VPSWAIPDILAISQLVISTIGLCCAEEAVSLFPWLEPAFEESRVAASASKADVLADFDAFIRGRDLRPEWADSLRAAREALVHLSYQS